MKHAHRIHAIDCACRHCRVPADRPAIDPGDRMARQVFAGIATGLVIAAIVDRWIGGPGLLAAFGF